MDLKKRSIGFTLIELLVVMAVIAVLAAVLFPVLGGAKEQGRMSMCASNLRQIGSAFTLYVDVENGRYPAGCRQAAPNEPARHAEQQPGVVTWDVALYPYINNIGVFRCPSDVKARPAHKNALRGITPHARSYSLNDQPLVDALIFDRDKSRIANKGTWMQSQVKSASRYVLIAECWGRKDYENEGGCKPGSYRYNDFGWGECYSMVDHSVSQGVHASGAMLNYMYFDGHVSAASTERLRDPSCWGYLPGIGYDKISPSCPLDI